MVASGQLSQLVASVLEGYTPASPPEEVDQVLGAALGEVAVAFDRGRAEGLLQFALATALVPR